MIHTENLIEFKYMFTNIKWSVNSKLFLLNLRIVMNVFTLKKKKKLTQNLSSQLVEMIQCVQIQSGCYSV